MSTKLEIMRNIHIIRDKLDMIEQKMELMERTERKLTAWLDTKPELVGEYETHWYTMPHEIQRRWWDGKRWSMPYLDIWREEEKMMARVCGQPERITQYIRYRGFTTKQE